MSEHNTPKEPADIPDSADPGWGEPLESSKDAATQTDGPDAAPEHAEKSPGAADAPSTSTNAEGGSATTTAGSVDDNGGGSNSKRALFVGIGIAVVLLVLAAASWTSARAKGVDDAALEAIPADAPIVLSIDLTEVVDGGRFERLFNRLAAQFPNDADSPKSWNELLDKVDDDSGISIREDLLPWLGRSSALAVFPGRDGDTVEVITVIAVRNHGEAKAFFDAAAAKEGLTATTVADGVEWADDSGIILLTDDLVLISPTRAMIDAALAALDGDSIVDLDAYTDAVNELPDNRFLTAYVDAGAVVALSLETLGDALRSQGIDQLPAGIDPSLLDTIGDLANIDDVGEVAFAATLSDAGLTFDIVASGGASVPGFDGYLPQLSELPDGTLAYLSFILNGEEILDQLEQGGLSSGLGSFGFDPSAELLAGVSAADLIRSISGPFQLIVADEPSLLSAVVDIELAGALSIGLGDTGPVDTLLESLTSADDFGFGFAKDDGLLTFGFGAAGVTFGVKDDALVAGTSRALIDSLSPGASVDKISKAFADVRKLLGSDGMFFFADLQLIAQVAPDSDFDLVSEIVTSIGGSFKQTASFTRGRLAVVLDY
ncbi:MAG: DUF3352 domain-containing protein [Acidobacteria bacterium]|nr:DUF3352 domain-containing protein [Acidobacteriota bacterium]